MLQAQGLLRVWTAAPTSSSTARTLCTDATLEIQWSKLLFGWGPCEVRDVLASMLAHGWPLVKVWVFSMPSLTRTASCLDKPTIKAALNKELY